MMDRAGANQAADLYHRAIELAGDPKEGCFALIAAAMACQEVLRGTLPPAKVDDLLNLLAVAGAVLFDDGCGGLFDLTQPAGNA